MLIRVPGKCSERPDYKRNASVSRDVSGKTTHRIEEAVNVDDIEPFRIVPHPPQQRRRKRERVSSRSGEGDDVGVSDNRR